MKKKCYRECAQMLMKEAHELRLKGGVCDARAADRIELIAASYHAAAASRERITEHYGGGQ